MTYSSIVRVNDIFDRHPARVNLIYNNFGATPHVTTQRFTYTIPAGKIAIIERVQLYQQRIAIVTNPGLVDMTLLVNATAMFVTLLHNATFAPAGLVASPGNFYTLAINLTNVGILLTGDIISLTSGWTADAGNTVFFYANVGLIVFDA
jgi:hypothetical protein